MPPLTTPNLIAYAGQVAIAVGIGGLLLWLFRVRHPRARLVLLRLMLATCVLLPFVQPLQQVQRAVAPMTTAQNSPLSPTAGATRSTSARTESIAGTWNIQSTLLAMAVAGVCVRVSWLALGLMSLRRLRQRSQPLTPPPPSVSWATAAVGVRAEVQMTDALDQPVSFGWLAPVVLVPADFTEFDEPMQRALICHELLHVRRRDWLHVLSEEAVRAALWFHPAVWWLIDQIHLAREQVVDGEVVRITGSRRPYLDVLLALASAQGAAPAIATAFLRRAHLHQRVALLLKEMPMSTPRLVVSMCMVTALLCSGLGVAASMLPLQAAPGFITQDDNGQQTPPRPVSKVRAIYPPAAAAAGIAGPVVLEVTTDTSGTPTGVHATSGASELTQAAEDALFMWRFAASDAPRTFAVGVNVLPESVEGVPAGAPALRVGGEIKPPAKVYDVRPIYPAEAQDAKVQGVVIAELTVGANGLVEDARVVKSVPELDAAALAAILQWRFTPTLLNGAAVPVILTVTANFTLK